MRKNKLPKIDPNDWIHLGRYLSNVLNHDSWSYWAGSRYLSGITSVKACDYHMTLDGQVYYWKESILGFAQEAETALANKDRLYMKYFRQAVDKAGRSFMVEADALGRSDQISLTGFQRYLRARVDLSGPWLMTFGLQIGAEAYLKNAAKIHGSDWQEYAAMVAPKKKLWLTRQSEEIASIARRVGKSKIIGKLFTGFEPAEIASHLEKSDPRLFKVIQGHARRYGWARTFGCVFKPYGIDEAISEISVHLTKANDHQKKKARPVPPDIKRAIDFASEVAYSRSHCAEVCGYGEYILLNRLSSLAGRLGLDQENLTWFKYHEIIDALKKGERFSRSTMKARQKKFGMVKFKGFDGIVMGKEIDRLLKYFTVKTDNNATEIKGIPASSGFARGRACILLEAGGLKALKKGEVLVAPETTPDYVPAMKIAAAIVTDTGGITSHAAIVSRELGIPCVIGTKIATQVLKDGDLVEVNADKGSIRIVARRK